MKSIPELRGFPLFAPDETGNPTGQPVSFSFLENPVTQVEVENKSPKSPRGGFGEFFPTRLRLKPTFNRITPGAPGEQPARTSGGCGNQPRVSRVATRNLARFPRG